MIEDELARLVDEFRDQVLDLLTRLINEAFDQALAASDLSKRPKATTARAPQQQHSDRPRPRRSRGPKATQIAATTDRPAPPEDDDRSEMTSPPTTKTAQPRPRRSAKGPSRDEIERLVQAGLASRLAVGSEGQSAASKVSVAGLATQAFRHTSRLSSQV